MGIIATGNFFILYPISLNLKLIMYFMYFAFLLRHLFNVLVSSFQVIVIFTILCICFLSIFLEKCVIVTVWANPLVAMLVEVNSLQNGKAL